MFGNKMKALTFSYDDGVTQDIRLAELFSKYGMKATFNINSDKLGQLGSISCGGVRVSHSKVKPEDVLHIYEGHEVASHTLTHPRLPAIEDENEIVRQVEEDRIRLSELCGYEVVGFAYPCGGKNFDSRVSRIIKNSTGIKYCRTIISSHSFERQENLFEFNPTIHQHGEFDKLFELGEEFLKLDAKAPAIFYIWGHSYELDARDDWARFEEFLQMMSGKDDIFYGTNKEILL